MGIERFRSIGINIKKARKERGLSQSEFADALGKSLRMVQKYESDEYSKTRVIPTIEVLENMANVLDVSVYRLLGMVSEPQMEEIPVFEILKKKKVIDKKLFDRISSEVIEMHKHGLIEDYIVTMSAEEFSVFVVDDSGSGAGLRGKFNGKYNDRGGFFDFLEEMREGLDE